VSRSDRGKAVAIYHRMAECGRVRDGGLEGRMAIKVDQLMQCLAHQGQKMPFKADSQSFSIFDAILPSSFRFPGGIKA